MAVPERKENQLQSAHSTGNNQRGLRNAILLAAGCTLLMVNFTPNEMGQKNHGNGQPVISKRPITEPAFLSPAAGPGEEELEAKMELLDRSFRRLGSDKIIIRLNALATIEGLIFLHPQLREAALEKCVELLKDEKSNKDDLYGIIYNVAKSDKKLETEAIRIITGIEDSRILQKIRLENQLDVVRLCEFSVKFGSDGVTKMVEYYNISFFGRYTKGMLEDAHNALENKPTGKIALIIGPKYDWNGAFYRAEVMDTLRGHYTILMIEAGNTEELSALARKISKDFGEISLVVLEGHGEPTKVKLGDEEYLNMTDGRHIKELAECMEVNSTLVFFSCSTGSKKVVKNIAQVFWETSDRAVNVFAPDDDTGILAFKFQNDEVSNVTYWSGVHAVYWRSWRWHTVR